MNNLTLEEMIMYCIAHPDKRMKHSSWLPKDTIYWCGRYKRFRGEDEYNDYALDEDIADYSTSDYHEGWTEWREV